MPDNAVCFHEGDALLEIAGLSVSLGRNSILENISFKVARGSIHALIGPNGAGKTTLIRSILGQMPHRGTIMFRFTGNGRIGYVPQFLDFDHSIPLTVSDFIKLLLQDYPLFLAGRKRNMEKVEEIISVTECLHLKDRMMGGLSGGEFRRVLLAQALFPIPELLLLDEPASNMDEVSTSQFEQLLKKLQKRHGLSILMVGHDIRRILALAGHVTAVNRRVVFDGKPDILQDPAKLAEIFGLGFPDLFAACKAGG